MALDKKAVITGACKRLLGRVPKKFVCPVCGKEHAYDFVRSISKTSPGRPINLRCTGNPGIEGFSLYKKDDHVIAKIITDGCEGTIGYADVVVPLDESDFEIKGNAMVTEVAYQTGDHYCRNSTCRYGQTCPSAIARDKKSSMIFFPLQLVYEDKDIKESMEEAENEVREREEREMAAKKVVEVKEDQVTECGSMNIMQMLYKRSPEANIEDLKTVFNKHKNTLKWVVPVATIYGAYLVLNKSEKTGINAGNIKSMSKKILGVDIAMDKKVVERLMQFGKIVAGAYAAEKLVNGLMNGKKGDMTVEEVEDGLEKIGGISKKFGFMIPTAQDLLPTAVVVIAIYAATNRLPEEGIFGKMNEVISGITGKFSLYIGFAKSWAAEKLNIDLADEEGQKRAKAVGVVAAFATVLVLLYGRKILDKKAVENKVICKMKTILKKIAPTVYASAISAMIARKIVSVKDVQIIDGEYKEVTEESPAEEVKEEQE